MQCMSAMGNNKHH